MAATITKETDGTFSVNMAGDSTISLATENTYLDKNIVFNIADSNYATQTWVGNNYQPKGTYLTAHQSLSDYATKSWCNTTFQPKGTYLTSHQSLSGYATQTWVQNQGYLTSHQSLTDYATKSWCNTTFQPKGTYLTEHQSLSGYATQTWVQNQKYLTSHQSLSGYATQTWVQSQGYLTSHQSLAGYATGTWVDTYYQPRGSYQSALGIKRVVCGSAIIQQGGNTPSFVPRGEAAVGWALWASNGSAPTTVVASPYNPSTSDASSAFQGTIAAGVFGVAAGGAGFRVKVAELPSGLNGTWSEVSYIAIWM